MSDFSLSNQSLLWSDAGSKWQHLGYISHPQQQEGVRPGVCTCRGMGSRDVSSKENVSLISVQGSLVAQTVKNPSAGNVGDLGSILGLGRCPGTGNGNPLQYSCLENPHGQRSLAGYSLWGCKQLDTTE